MNAQLRIHSRLTRLGWFTCAGAFLLTITAFILPNAYAVYLGIGLFTACFISFILGRRHLKHVHSRWLLPPSPHAGQFNTIGAEIYADQDAAPVSLHAYEPRSQSAQLVTAIPGISTEHSRITWPIFFPQRGQVALPPLELASELPFGLVESRCENSNISRIIVLPYIGNVKQDLHIELENWLLQKRIPSPNGTDELVRLRPYQHGDSPRMVHWRASARSRQLIVSVRSDLNDIHISLVLDCTCKQKQSRRFERLISMAATIVDHAHKHGWSISLHGHFAPAQGLFQSRLKLMECLALVQNKEQDCIKQYIPKQQHSLVLTLQDDLEQECDSPCRILTLRDLEQHIALARERR